MTEYVACPECGLPAEVVDVYELASTAGPLTHTATSCVVKHHLVTVE